MNILPMTNNRGTESSFASLLHQKMKATSTKQEALASGIGSERTIVNRWTQGGEVPSPEYWPEIARELKLSEDEAAGFRLAAAWARLSDDARNAIAPFIDNLAKERDAAVATTALLREEHKKRLDAPDVKAAIDDAVKRSLTTRADIAEATLSVAVRGLADALPGREAEVVEGLLAFVATACARKKDEGARFAEGLLKFRKLDDFGSRHALLDGLVVQIETVYATAASYASRALDYGEQMGAFAPSFTPAIDDEQACLGSAFGIPRMEMPEQELLGKASITAKQRLWYLMDQLGRGSAALAKLGPSAWTNPTPTPAPSPRGARRKRGAE